MFFFLDDLFHDDSKMWKDDPRCNKSWNAAKNGRSEAKSVDCLGHVPLSDTGICAVVDRFCLNCEKTRENRAWRLGGLAARRNLEHLADLAVSVPKIFVSRIVGKNPVYRQHRSYRKDMECWKFIGQPKRSRLKSGQDDPGVTRSIDWYKCSRLPVDPLTLENGELGCFFFGFFREDF